MKTTCRCDGNYYLDYDYEEMSSQPSDIINKIETMHLLSICLCTDEMKSSNIATDASITNEPSIRDTCDVTEINTRNATNILADNINTKPFVADNAYNNNNVNIDSANDTDTNKSDTPFTVFDINNSNNEHEIFLSKTTLIQNNFTFNEVLNNAAPHTSLYNKICTSTPIIAASILIEHFNVLEMNCSFMEPTINNIQSFYIKHNNK